MQGLEKGTLDFLRILDSTGFEYGVREDSKGAKVSKTFCTQVSKTIPTRFARQNH